MRFLITLATLLVATPLLGTLSILASYFGARPKPGNVLEQAPRWWASVLLRAAGVRVVLHQEERTRGGEPRIFVCNHVSWFDVLALAASLPRYNFVAKAELFSVP